MGPSGSARVRKGHPATSALRFRADRDRPWEMEEFVAAGYRRHYGRVYRFVRRRARSAEDAEDLTQEVFEAAAAAFANERLTSEPELAWLYTVAERRLVDSWRRQRRAEALVPDGEAGAASVERGAYGAEVTQACSRV